MKTEIIKALVKVAKLIMSVRALLENKDICSSDKRNIHNDFKSKQAQKIVIELMAEEHIEFLTKVNAYCIVKIYSM